MKKTEKIRSKWLKRIEAEKSKHKDFRRKAKKAIDVYQNDLDKDFGKDNNSVEFPILRSVIDVQLGALTSKMPQAKISKRFEYQNQSKLCSKIEKAVNYYIEKGNMQNEVYQSAEDYLTAGLGGLRVLYDAEIEVIEVEVQSLDELGMVQTEIQEQEQIKSESLIAERFEWCNFGWQPCKRWSDCDWIYFRSTFTQAEFESKYQVKPSGIDLNDEEKQDISVYEIWDKLSKNRIVICESHDEVLELDKNPLGADYFYPCAEPLFFALKHDSLTPTPEFHFWSQLHKKIQTLTKRETNLIKSIKDVEYFDKEAFTEFSQLQDASDGKKIPIDLSRWSAGGQASINNAVSAKDNSSALSVLQVVVQRRDDCLSKIYQVTGIGDIMQAASDPNETATAQNLKHSWGSARLSSKRFCIENHIRATIEIMVNSMIKLFSPESIIKASGEQLTPEEQQELQTTGEYRIDVETLSTLSIDKDRDQQNSVSLLQAISGLFAQSQAIPQPLTQALLKNVVEVFVNGNELQEVIEQLPQYFNELQQAQQQMQQAQQQAQQAQQVQQQMQAQNQAMAQKLNSYNEAKQAKDMAETAKKQAETQKIQIETTQKANEQIVEQNAYVDELQALQTIGNQPDYVSL